ncbi:copper transporter 5.1-like [Acanthaster planci]|uniref:Copper transport protein n=1 Tax=Acanthaster planci TaxID=133434 RepID=A0A8B7XZY9_ACAPL|nr:copper transporter 5.1-like [Acanthaster planci]
MDSEVKDVLTHLDFSTEVTILFQRWHVTTIPGLVLSCACLVIVAFFYRLLKVLIGIYAEEGAASDENPPQETADEKKRILGEIGKRKVQVARFLSKHNVIQILLSLAKRVLGYALILVVVTYNGWLILSILTGLVLGHVAELAWKRGRNVTTDDDVDDEG